MINDNGAARRLYPVCRKYLTEELEFRQPDQQHTAEYIAGDQFAQPHRQRVERERRGESGAEACAVPPQKRADDQGVGEYRGQRRKPLPFCGELCCDAGGQQCGKRAADAVSYTHLDVYKRQVYSGFLGCTEQIGVVEDFIRRFGKDDALAIVDPVMGDNGIRYVTYTDEMCAATRRLTETCLLYTSRCV